MPDHSPPHDWEESSHELGQRLLHRREALGLSQERLASLAGISRNQIYNIEKSHNSPSMDTLWSIAAVLEISASELINDLGRS
ncbi:helix-turn-helix domain-containing protein [Aeromicrobium sp. CF4.19]|uniref:helix-turn-helix domain-containing protein n=1 Tax=Aeromicrobium sp. CF4.19 TaxID=3373082 RepID=UPI003EE461CF